MESKWEYGRGFPCEGLASSEDRARVRAASPQQLQSSTNLANTVASSLVACVFWGGLKQISKKQKKKKNKKKKNKKFPLFQTFTILLHTQEGGFFLLCHNVFFQILDF